MKNILKKIFLGFSKDAASQKFAEASLEDGTKLMTESEDFYIGAEVYVVTEDGNILAPDGEYATSDGKSFTLVEGKVTESTVERPESTTEEVRATENPMVTDIQSWMAAVSDSLNALTDRIASIEQSIAEFISKDENHTEVQASEEGANEVAGLKSEIESLKSQLVELSKSPSATSVKKEANDALPQEKPLSYAEKVAQGALNSIKK